MKKKILSVVMACVMAVSCCSGVMAMAAYNDNLQTTTIETNDGVIFEIKDGVEDSFVGGMRRDSYIAVDSSLNDKSGSQMIPFRTNSDYPYYRVFVSNTSKTSYNITLTDASGKNQLTSSPITLGAGRHTNITNVMLERRLKANYRTGFWEMIFLHTKPLAAVPSDMRAGRN